MERMYDFYEAKEIARNYYEVPYKAYNEYHELCYEGTEDFTLERLKFQFTESKDIEIIHNSEISDTVRMLLNEGVFADSDLEFADICTLFVEGFFTNIPNWDTSYFIMPDIIEEICGNDFNLCDMNFLEMVDYLMDEYGLDEDLACDEARAYFDIC